MDISPTQKNDAPEENNQAEKKSLIDIRKSLETGETISSDAIKELKSGGLSRARDLLQDPAAQTVINVNQAQGTININAGSARNSEAKKNIPTDFFLKQKGFSSSNISHKGGRL